MRDEAEHPAQAVKSQVLKSVDCILAISIWNDQDAKELAESLGAKTLLDKTKLYSELIPAIKHFCKLTGGSTAPHDVATGQSTYSKEAAG